MARTTKFSYSQLSTFQSCRKSWDYSYKQRVVPVSLVPRMFGGTIVHHGIAKYLEGLDSSIEINKFANSYIDRIKKLVVDSNSNIVDELVRENEIYVLNHLEEWRIITNRACSYYFNELGFEPVRENGKLLVEFEVVVDIPELKGAQFEMHADVLLKDKAGQFWLTDFKLRDQFHDINQEEFKIQTPVYQKIMRIANSEYANNVGHMIAQIRNKLPEKPTLNKNGTMSKTRIACSWDEYKQELQNKGLNPADYEEEMKPKLDYKFWEPIKLSRSESECDFIWNHIVVPLCKEIMYRPTTNRSPDFIRCQSCRYKQPCWDEVYGVPPEETLSSFTKKENLKDA